MPEPSDTNGENNRPDAFSDANSRNDSPLHNVPIEVTVSVGRARPLVRDLMSLTRDSVLPLDRRVDDLVELYVGERMIARGKLVELGGKDAGGLAVSLTEVADPGRGL